MKPIIFAFLILCLTGRTSVAGEALVAVASNFLKAAEALEAAFEAETGHDVLLSHGSTGALYAQIVSGAPFDLFLSADDARPELLVSVGLADEARPYAYGRLILVGRASVELAEAAAGFEGRRVALADPMVAPYGAAAVSAMEALSLDTGAFQPLLVSNVGQVATLFVTGNAELAFLSAGQVPYIGPSVVMPLDGVAPLIQQDAVLLNRAAENEAARAFWAFLQGERAREVILANGYNVEP